MVAFSFPPGVQQVVQRALVACDVEGGPPAFKGPDPVGVRGTGHHEPDEGLGRRTRS